MIAMIGVRRPGITWRRGACCWEGWNGKSYIWVRSPWLVALCWLALAAVVGFLGFGLGR